MNPDKHNSSKPKKHEKDKKEHHHEKQNSQKMSNLFFSKLKYMFLKYNSQMIYSAIHEIISFNNLDCIEINDYMKIKEKNNKS